MCYPFTYNITLAHNFGDKRLTDGVSGGLPRESAIETGNVFERKNAAKRNVANRPTAHIIRRDLADLSSLIKSYP